MASTQGGDLHEGPGQGQDLHSCLYSWVEGVVAADDLEDVEVAALDAGGGPGFGQGGARDVDAPAPLGLATKSSGTGGQVIGFSVVQQPGEEVIEVRPA